MNNKGFTIIELLAVIVILSVLMGIASVGVMAINTIIKERTQETKEELILEGAKRWGQDNRVIFTSTPSVEKTVQYFIDSGYLDTDSMCTVSNTEVACLINEETKESMADIVIVISIENNYVYASFK